MLGKALAITSLIVAMVTIRSATQSTCLDAATTNPGGDMAGQKCTATTSQSFAFHPISGAPPGPTRSPASPPGRAWTSIGSGSGRHRAPDPYRPMPAIRNGR